MRKRLVLTGVVALSLTATIGLGASPSLALGTARGTIVRVDAVAGGGVPAQGAEVAGISSGGRYVLWSTADPDVDPHSQIEEYYVTDLMTGTAQLATKTLSGDFLTGRQWMAVLSSNGRYVAYISNASDLPYPGRPSQQGSFEVYRYDTQTGQTRTESLTAAGGRPHGNAIDVAISASGRYVVYTSTATNLPGGTKPLSAQAYLFDNQTGQTFHLTTSVHGGPSDGYATGLSVSSDGRYVVFGSQATDLLPTPQRKHKYGVYLLDRQNLSNGATLISHGPSGLPVKGGTGEAAISADGSTVVYVMSAFGVPPEQEQRIYRYDVATGQRRLINDTGMTNPTGFWSLQGTPTISADGRFVAYRTRPTGPYLPANVLRYDAATGHTQFLYRPMGVSNTLGPGSTGAYISADGQHAAFDNAVPPITDPSDTNGTVDTYEWSAAAPH